MKRPLDIIVRVLLALYLGCCIIACEEDSGGTSEKAQKFNLTLSRYYVETGATSLPLWTSTGRAGMFHVESGTSEAKYAYPTTFGSSSALFVFALDMPSSSTSGTLVGFYPEDLDIECCNGVVTVELDEEQNGMVSPCLLGETTVKLPSVGINDITLSQLYCVMYITITKGDYSIAKAEIVANGGEGIAGKITLDPNAWTVEASERKVTVTPSSPLDCSEYAQTIAAMLAPVTLSEGYTVTLYTTEGESFSVESRDAVALEAGGIIETDSAAADSVSKLIFCGDNMVYMIDADLADENGFDNAVLWSLDVKTLASILGLASSRCDHLDECKVVDNNSKLLLTSSYGWCVLLDIESSEVLFYTTSCSNAHSAELLPDGRIVVACSTGSNSTNNCVQLYDMNSFNNILDSATLTSAHGVVWNDTTERLYAIGGQSLNIFSLSNWTTSSPALSLERAVTLPKSGSHDLTYVDSNTLCVAGNGAFLYTIGASTFTELTHFSSMTAIKSLNYNSDNGEVWYTDATVPEGNEDWSTHTLCHAASGNATSTDRLIKFSNLDCYKVRVVNW